MMLRHMGRDGPSSHLRWSELACHDAARTPYPERWRVRCARILATAFEDIRDHWGVPIPILSAYRTPEHNEDLRREARRLGLPLPARYSYHKVGMALDLGRPHGVTLAELHEAALEEARKPGSPIRGVGKYLYGCHLDIRQSLRLVVWTGKRLEAEVSRG